jgi:RNA polymerase sigma-70 factor (ECF subfamily)
VSRVTTPRESLSRQLAEARFRKLYADHGREILAYALRRVHDPEDAADVLAETFLVAWRRSADIPAGPQARLWLYGVARRTLANHRRGELRRTRLNERLRAELDDAISDWAPPDDGAGEALAALGRLDPRDRELLRLTAWEELSPRQAATVLGLSAVAARSRLHRARRRLRRELENSGPDLQRQGTSNPRREDEAK